LELSDIEKDNREFINDGLFNEFSYVYNEENDTLEIYRGFFKTKQNFRRSIREIKKAIITALDENKEKGVIYFCHLIMIIDRKKHTKEQVLRAFEEYNKEEELNIEENYPERRIIPLEIPENYVSLVRGGYNSGT